MIKWIGIDIGTTAVKAILTDDSGKLLDVASVEYPLYSPEADFAEQNPEEIWRAFCKSVQELAARSRSSSPNAELKGIGFSSAMHSLLAVDSEGNPLTQSITWADNRSQSEAEELHDSGLAAGLHQRTGTPIHPMTPLTKLIWMRKNLKDTFEQAARFLSIKEWIWQRLTGSYEVDESIASATALWNSLDRRWDEQALQVAGIGADRLSKVVSALHSRPLTNTEFAVETGLPLGTPLTIGASDGVLANLGVRAFEPGIVALSLGTSGALRTMRTMREPTPGMGTFCYALMGDLWTVGGPFNNAGLAFRWLREQWGRQAWGNNSLPMSDEELLTLAELSPPGANGLLFLPYLTGDRAPHWNSSIRAALFGVNRSHSAHHLARAVIEGVVYSAYDVFRSLKTDISRIRVTGGIARSPFWMQMIADMFGAAVEVSEVGEASGIAAALLARAALHKKENGAASTDLNRENNALEWLKNNLPNAFLQDDAAALVYTPDPGRHAFYQKGYTVYTSLYPAVRDHAKDLLELANESQTLAKGK